MSFAECEQEFELRIVGDMAELLKTSALYRADLPNSATARENPTRHGGGGRQAGLRAVISPPPQKRRKAAGGGRWGPGRVAAGLPAEAPRKARSAPGEAPAAARRPSDDGAQRQKVQELLGGDFSPQPKRGRRCSSRCGSLRRVLRGRGGRPAKTLPLGVRRKSSAAAVRSAGYASRSLFARSSGAS